MDQDQHGKTPSRPVYLRTGNGIEYEGALSVDPQGRPGFEGGNPFDLLRRASNVQSNRPLTYRRVRMRIEDLEAE